MFQVRCGATSRPNRADFVCTRRQPAPWRVGGRKSMLVVSTQKRGGRTCAGAICVFTDSRECLCTLAHSCVHVRSTPHRTCSPSSHHVLGCVFSRQTKLRAPAQIDTKKLFCSSAAAEGPGRPDACGCSTLARLMNGVKETTSFQHRRDPQGFPSSASKDLQ